MQPPTRKQCVTRNARKPIYTRRSYVAPGVWYILPKTGEKFCALGPLAGYRGTHNDLDSLGTITRVHGNMEVLVPAAIGYID